MKYVIADVHGCFDTLMALIKTIEPKCGDSLYMLGDYVDRGRKSKQVLDWMMEFQEVGGTEGAETVYLMGNHETLMLEGYDNKTIWNDVWAQNGMDYTMRSFPTYPVIPPEYMEFLRGMPLIHKVDGYYLAHAGIEDIEDPMFSNPEVLLWDREITPKQHKVIVGHTPTPLEAIQESLTTNKILLDNGCVFKNHELYGNLVALRLDDMQLIIQPNIEVDVK